ncbi:LCP family protein [Nocardioides bigeumensis]|uniref:LCP family protein n=1 Tax=Nocardioides bigeumensis TaxID=433657 RepID=A0ABN2XSC3_9ACTN
MPSLPSFLRDLRRPVLVVMVVAPVGLLAVWFLNRDAYLGLAVGLALVLVIAGLVLAVLQWRHGYRRFAAIVTALSVLVAGSVSAYLWTLNDALGDITQIATPFENDDEGRPEKPPNTSLNILLMGADDPEQLVDKPTVAELLEDGAWNPGAYRSDTLMVVHVPADRKAAYLVSIPRDSFVPIYDQDGEEHGEAKINEAFSQYGPFGTWRTVEELSGLHIDHMAIIDFNGFRELTSAIGGVDVYIPEDVYDSKQDQEWKQGEVHLEGVLALKYVRMRYGLTQGDFDRVDRQQNFLRAVMKKMLSKETVGSVTRFPATLRAITGHLTTDDWPKNEIRRLAFGLRGLDGDKVRFVTLPNSGTATDPAAGSIVVVDERRAKVLFDAMESDRVGAYLRRNPDDELPDEDEVS